MSLASLNFCLDLAKRNEEVGALVSETRVERHERDAVVDIRHTRSHDAGAQRLILANASVSLPRSLG